MNPNLVYVVYICSRRDGLPHVTVIIVIDIPRVELYSAVAQSVTDGRNLTDEEEQVPRREPK